MGTFAPQLPATPSRSVRPATLQRTALALQRKCACGGGASGSTGECESCRRKKTAGVQTKLVIGESGDPLEHEADRVAERVLAATGGFEDTARPAVTPVRGRPAEHDAAPASFAPKMAHANRAPKAGHDFSDVRVHARERMQPEVPSQAADLAAGGSPLDIALRRYFEPRFGRDLSDVRVHTGARAESWNEGLNAHAFTYGNHIWLGRGHRPRADFLLAHELAHVIQQRQPRPLRQAGVADHAEATPPLSGSESTVRRLELGDPFWVPLGGKGKKGGSEIHKDLLAIAQANNSNLDVEAPAPNATDSGSKLGMQGSIDLYQGKNKSGFHARVGLFFDGSNAGSNPHVLTATPKKHRRATVAGIKNGEFNPFVTDTGGIDGIELGPSDVGIGELKPASLHMLGKGETQIGYYQDGMKEAARLTNDWARLNRPGQKWSLNSVAPLPDAAVKFKDGGNDLKFDPANPRDDKKLVLATISESSSIGGKYNVTIRFNPEQHGLPPIKGGLYAQLFRPGKGLWTYFARPKNLADALKLARSALIKGEMTLANQVQDQVIDPLFAAPKKAVVAPLRRTRRREDAVPAAASGAATPLAPVAGRTSPLVVRRAAKSPQLKDDFDGKLAKWKENHAALRAQISGPTATEDTKKKIASLELLERAYEAEEALDKVQGTGKTTLPPKSTDVVNIVSGTGTGKAIRRRNLADLAGWLQGWTSKPAEVLGTFRDKFGGGFVWVANKVIDLRDRIRQKYRETFDKHPSKPGGSTGKIIAKALLKALLQVAKVLIPRAAHLFMDAVVAGVKKKIEKVFDIDPRKFAEDLFGEDFRKWIEKLEEFKKDAETYVIKIVEGYAKDLGWFKDIFDKARTIGRVLEVASIMILCGKKPGWNCLVLLSKTFRECGMEAALNICEVQKEIAGIVAEVGPLANLPAALAQKSLDIVRDAAPDGLKDVLSEPVAGSGTFDANEIECESSPPPETFCPGIPLAGGAGGPSEREQEQTKEEAKEKGKEEEKGQSPGPKGEKEDLNPPPGQQGRYGEKPGAGGLAPPEPPPPPPPSKELPEAGTTPSQGTESDVGVPGGTRPGPTTPAKDKPGAKPQGEGAKPEDTGAQAGPGGTGGTQPGGTGGQGQPAAAQEIESLPKPEEVHKELNELLNEQGPERLGALAKLAEAAGMPGDQPLTAEQVKQLRKLLSKGGLSAEDLRKLEAGKAKPDVKRRSRPLEQFLEKEAHRAVMEQTLENLRQKQYEFKFNEMAKLKVHWRILRVYQPGPFRNAPALMWTETMRAAGVVDGEYGKCYDGGKIPLTITRADMREEGSEKKIVVHTPFHDKDAKLTGGVCPPPPPQPKGASGGKGQGQGQGQGEGGAPKGGEARGPGEKGGQKEEGGSAGKGGAAEQPPREEEGKGEGQGGAGGQGEVDSDVRPGDKGDPIEGGAEKERAEEDKPEHEPREQTLDPLEVDVASLGKSCGFPPACTSDWRVDFEELGQMEDGFQVMPDKVKDPDGTLSMLNPPNKLSPFSLRTAPDGSQEIVMTCEGRTCVVGKVTPSPVRAGMMELVSGPLLDSLRATLREFLQKRRSTKTNRVDRIHFF